MKQVSTYPLRLPTSLKAAVAEISREEGTSINQFVALAVAEKVSAMRTAEFFASKRDEADIEAALQILRRRGGQPPNSDDGYPREGD
ncbi:MAG: toxin-antitoxin system HicB family antitoxin [Gammaproteobacteria bacterium]|nr:toxin-antitoxin system HicB family antitoxin [Gammaproteobacteria bacterium]MYE51497.1 toxin-antitoxin system HicB family antitoxin [Gammaproteobacteria bacterium]MYF52034.1 toxin-antitoxin system HicB family antitoxin [Gammaproteobacteria bacterium]